MAFKPKRTNRVCVQHFSHHVWSSDLETGGFCVFLCSVSMWVQHSVASPAANQPAPAARTLIRVLMHIKPSSSVCSFSWCDTGEARFCLCEQILSLSVSQVDPLSKSSAVGVLVPSCVLNSSLGALMAQPWHIRGAQLPVKSRPLVYDCVHGTLEEHNINKSPVRIHLQATCPGSALRPSTSAASQQIIIFPVSSVWDVPQNPNTV